MKIEQRSLNQFASQNLYMTTIRGQTSAPSQSIVLAILYIVDYHTSLTCLLTSGGPIS